MVIGHRFFFKTLDMNKNAGIVIVGIALAAHAPGSMFVQFIKIMVDDLLCGLLPVLRHREGHHISYHKRGVLVLCCGKNMADTNKKMLLDQAAFGMNGHWAVLLHQFVFRLSIFMVLAATR